MRNFGRVEVERGRRGELGRVERVECIEGMGKQDK